MVSIEAMAWYFAARWWFPEAVENPISNVDHPNPKAECREYRPSGMDAEGPREQREPDDRDRRRVQTKNRRPQPPWNNCDFRSPYCGWGRQSTRQLSIQWRLALRPRPAGAPKSAAPDPP